MVSKLYDRKPIKSTVVAKISKNTLADTARNNLMLQLGIYDVEKGNNRGKIDKQFSSIDLRFNSTRRVGTAFRAHAE